MNLLQLVNQTKHLLYGAGAYEDRVAELTNPVGAFTDYSITVDDASEFGKGIIEIGFEQMRVSGVSNSTLTVFKFGRGYNGTVSSAHDPGSEVTYQPMLAAGTIKDTINRVINSLYPSLYAVKTDTLLIENGGVTLPSDAVGIIAVVRGGEREDNYRWEPDNLKRLTLRHGIYGHVRIVYAVAPKQLQNPDDDFALTGLPDRLADIIAVGAAAELAPFLDMGRVAHTGMESRTDDQSRPAGYAVQVGSKMKADFQKRLENEMQILYKEHPIRVHRERLNYGS